MCRSSGPRWIWCQAWSPTSGSSPPEAEPSSYSALSYAVLRTMPCVARSSLMRRANIRRGYENRKRSHNCRLAPDKRRERGRPGFEPRAGIGGKRRSARWNPRSSCLIGKSEGIPMVDITIGAAGAIQPAEVKDVELYHPKSWVTKYVFSQDAKVIAIQYSITALSIGLVALVLSWLIRLQLAFPSSFSAIGPGDYLQFITMHGMIMVIYLLTALFLGGFGNYLIPLMVGARDMVFPYVNMLSYWVYLLAVVVPAGRCTRRRRFSPVPPGRIGASFSCWLP